jgi:hypothetical protein
VAASSCWYVGCELGPVAELCQIVVSPLRGEIVTWRGACPEHLRPRWVEGDVVYRWTLKLTSSQGELPAGAESG